MGQNLSYDTTSVDDILIKCEQATHDHFNALDECADITSGFISASFELEGTSKLWKPLQPITLEMRASRGYDPGPIEVQSGTLRDSYLKGGEGNLYFNSGSELMYGSLLPYASFQYEGGQTSPQSRFPNTTVPPRPPFETSPLIIAEYRSVIELSVWQKLESP